MKKSNNLVFVIVSIFAAACQIIVLVAGNDLGSIEESELQDNSLKSPNDEQMDELYDELDKKAYEYMLEQGLISESEEIRFFLCLDYSKRIVQHG